MPVLIPSSCPAKLPQPLGPAWCEHLSEMGMGANHLLELGRRSWGGARTAPAVPALSPAPNFQLSLFQPLRAWSYKGINKSILWI